MSSELVKFKITGYSTWEDAAGKLFVSVNQFNDIPSSFGEAKYQVSVIVGAIGCENDSRNMNIGDVIKYNAGEYGTYEIRLLNADRISSSFYIVKIK